MSKGYFLVFLTAIISGFSIFINRFGVSAVNPYVFTWLKNLTVVFLLTGIILIFKDWSSLKTLVKKQWFLLVIIGLVGGAIPFLLFFKGLSLTMAARGSFLHKTMFIYVAILAFVFLKEKVDKRFLFGGLVLILGNLFLLKELPYSINQGDILIFLAALFWAAENVISKYVLESVPARVVAWARMFFGSLFIFAFLLITGQLVLLTGLTLGQVSLVMVTSLILFGYLVTWYSGLKYIPVSKATVILLLGSPITTLLSFVSSGQVSFQEVMAGALIVLGIVLVIGIQESWRLIKKIKKTLYVWA